MVPTTTTITAQGIAGGTITAGQPLYADAADSNKLKPAQSDTAVKAAVVGIALGGASSGQPVSYAVGGDVTFNAGFTKGKVYLVSNAAAGGIAPSADLSTAGVYISVLGVSTSTSNLKLGLLPSAATV